MNTLAELDDYVENLGPDVTVYIEETFDQKVKQAVDFFVALLIVRSSEVLDHMSDVLYDSHSHGICLQDW